jgi:stage V sporulation protein G
MCDMFWSVASISTARRTTVEVTEVRVKLMDEPGDRLKAFCSVTFDDCFVIRDLKIIEGATGPFVAMPSRKLTSHCRKCGSKNHLRAYYCNQCGARQEDSRAPKDADGRAKLYADVAHPINSACREMIQENVIHEYYEELERAKQPGYVSRYDDFDYEFDDVPMRGSRIDEPHEDILPTRPHTLPSNAGLKTANEHGPHFHSDAAADRSINRNPPTRTNDAFGAGIFPTD